jgi:hypothetical protein
MKRRRIKSREFELLASRIESALAPAGAKVKSPDRIRDKFTGQYREVDASIRYTVGSCELLITIECRDRSRIQDVTWIEQLATKRAHIGADRTIAVSSTDFTAAAAKAAAAHNISIRRIADLTDDEIHSLTHPIEVTVGTINLMLGRMAVTYVGETMVPLELDHSSRNLFCARAWDAPIFHCRDTQGPVSLHHLIAQSKPQQHNSGSSEQPPATLPSSAVLFGTDPLSSHFEDVPLDGSSVTRCFTIQMKDEEVFVSTTLGLHQVREVSFEVIAKRQTQMVPVSRVALYSDEHRIVGRFTEHELQLGGGRSLRVFSHPTPDSNKKVP